MPSTNGGSCGILANMQSRSPSVEGFRAMFRRPALGLAEIAWRWSFGFTVAALLVFAVIEYLHSLPVNGRDMAFLGTSQPALISRAITDIFRGSAPRAVAALLVLVISMTVAWIALASLGRATTLRPLVGYFRELAGTGEGMCQPSPQLSALLGLNFLRVAVAAAAGVGCVGALLLAVTASPHENFSPATALLVFVILIMLVWLAWSVVNWFLSLAAVFVVSQGQDTFGAVSAAVEVCRSRTGAVFAAGGWFGLGHAGAFFLAGTVVAFPLAMAGTAPPSLVLTGVALVTLFYFAVVDFLYIGRLAAYLAIVELRGLPPPPVVIPPRFPSGGTPGSAVTVEPSAGIDKDEVILSDVPENLHPR